MNRFLFICIAFSFPLMVIGQGFIDYSPAKVKKKLEQYMAETNLRSEIRQNDSLISLTIDDSSVKPSSFIFHFVDNKCVEEIKLSCDTCVIKFRDEILENRSMEWKKINETTWLSKFSRHRIMILELNGIRSSLKIRKTNWDKKTYKGVIASLE